MKREIKSENGKLEIGEMENGKNIMCETCPDKKNRDAKNAKGET